MKIIKPAIALLCLLALCAPARAIVDPFIRAGVDFSQFNAIDNIRDSSRSWNDRLSGWNAGCFVEAGLTLLGSHTLAVEAGYMKADNSVGESENGLKSREQIPLLLNYRRSFNLGPASLYLGLSAGMMSDKASWRDDINGAAKNFASANWVALYGATAGVGLKLGAHWGLDVGVRALAVNEKEYKDGALSDADKSYSIGKSKVYLRPNARIALSLRW